MNRTTTNDIHTPADAERVLRLREVIARVGLKRSCIYGLIKNGQFPEPIRLTRAAVGWLETDISNWISKRAARRGGA